MITKASILLVLALVVGSCRSNIENPDEDAGNRFVMNGADYSATEFIGYTVDSVGMAFQLGQIINISIKGAVPNTGETFTIQLKPEFVTLGEYSVGGGTNTGMFLTISKDGSKKRYHAESGTITIEAWPQEGTAKGRFTGSFAPDDMTGSPVLELTNGSFELPRR